MKTKKEETTLVQHACAKVAGFKTLHKRLERKIIVNGKVSVDQQLRASKPAS